MERFESTRRDLFKIAGVAALGSLVPEFAAAQAVPAQHATRVVASPVALTRCETYGVPAVTAGLKAMLDNLGGFNRLVAGKTVGVKINMTGSPGGPALGLAPGRTYQTHPDVILAMAILLDGAGARRIRFMEGTYSRSPIESTLLSAGWDLKALGALRTPVEFEDTRNSAGKPYALLKVPGGGDLFPAYQINRSYMDCDVFVSIAKLKNHRTAGVTLTMKNCFGITPTSLYGSHNANENFIGARFAVIHAGTEHPSYGVPQELHPDSPRVESYRVPRHIVDIAGIRPIDLAIIDGIETIACGEGPWYTGLKLQQPGLLVAGRNSVSTDAIGTVCMGYDPMAKAATGPFPGDNHLELAAARGLGIHDPHKIEVRGLGTTLKNAIHPFQWQPDRRNT